MCSFGDTRNRYCLKNPFIPQFMRKRYYDVKFILYEYKTTSIFKTKIYFILTYYLIKNDLIQLSEEKNMASYFQ